MVAKWPLFLVWPNMNSTVRLQQSLWPGWTRIAHKPMVSWPQYTMAPVFLGKEVRITFLENFWLKGIALFLFPLNIKPEPPLFPNLFLKGSGPKESLVPLRTLMSSCWHPTLFDIGKYLQSRLDVTACTLGDPYCPRSRITSYTGKQCVLSYLSMESFLPSIPKC